MKLIISNIRSLLFVQPKDVICVWLQLGVMTYGDVTKQSPETQAAIEQEVRVLLKVTVPTANSKIIDHNFLCPFSD